jgi:hypothetical protein
VKNAFIRRGYEVYANRNITISYFSGPGHPGFGPLTPEPFDSTVEAQ